MARCLIGLGANLGDKIANVAAAVELLGSGEAVQVLQVSGIHETEPVGGPQGQDSFANAAALIETDLSARQLIELLLETEVQFGRHRDIRWQARTLDMDLLLHEHEIVNTEKHIVPHPRMSFRRFVLEPCAEIAGDFIHPLIKLTIDQLLEAINLTPKNIAVESSDDAAASELIDAVGIESEQLCFVSQLRRTINKISEADTEPPLPISLGVAMMNCDDSGPDRLHQQARQTLLGEIRSPMLVVDRDNLEAARTELLAAIEAMR